MNEDYQAKLNSPSPLNRDQWLSLNEASGYLRISKDTLRRWEREKILKSHRSPTNRRYYRKEDLANVFSQKPDLSQTPASSPPASQVPSKDQKRESSLTFIVVFLLGLYAAIVGFLSWLLLRSQ